MLCEVTNTAIRINGEKILVGTIKEFDDKLVRSYPEILVPINRDNKEESEIKSRIIELQAENNKLKQENIKLVYSVQDRDKTVNRLTKTVGEYKEKINLLTKKPKKIINKKGK